MGAGAGREAARVLWPLVLQLWQRHPLVLLVIAGVVAVAVAFGLSYLWDIIRPRPWRPHEVYRPPEPDDDRPKTGWSRYGPGRGPDTT